MKVSEFQQLIFEQTGLKTSVKKQSGSMKRHYAFKQWELFKKLGIACDSVNAATTESALNNILY